MMASRVRAIEADPTVTTREAAVRALAGQLGLDDFGDLLMGMPNPEYPKLSGLLPAMASDAVQDSWTGSHGHTLLKQTATFVRSLSYNYARLTGSSLQDAAVLDFGCGWGRIARLMWYFTAPANLVGVDPWDASMAECRKAGMGDTFLRSDYLPERLPVDDGRFDVAYAFSVFTHLSEEAALSAFAAIRAAMREGAILLITIRPVEYWELRNRMYGAFDYVAREREHERRGFSFYPLAGAAGTAATATYGDTSMTLEWIADHVPGWRSVALDRALEDEYQVYVYLRAV